MALQTFTAGQVLTAAQVNALQANDFNQTVSTKTADYVLVAADKGTRVEMNSGSATTITVDTDLFNAGDTLFIQNIGAGVCTITAGTATVSTAGSLALVENAGGTLYFISAGVAVFYASGVDAASGLTLINTTSFSAVASQAISSIFSATYDTYMVVFNTTSNTGDADHSIKLRSGVTDLSTTYYGYGRSTDVAGVATNWGMNNATTGIKLGEQDNTESAGNAQYILFISAPFIANRTKFTWQGFFASKTGGLNQVIGGGIVYNNTSYDGMNFIASAGTFSGTVSTYGVNK